MTKIIAIILIVFASSFVYAEDLYIAQSAAGGGTGADCDNALAYTFFNTAGNWGGGVGEIDPGDTVHICGTLTGSANSTLLTFQASGTLGNDITIFFETDAKIEAPYFSSNGGINLNEKDYIIIDGGSTCGQISGTKTTCNGTIRNTLAGSSGLECPGGTCTTVLNNSTASNGIKCEGTCSNIEIKNLHIGPMYTRELNTNQEGFATHGIVIQHGSAQNVKIHNNVIEGAGKLAVVAWADAATGTLETFHFYNNNLSNMCWAIGMGKGSNNDAGQIDDIQIYENEMSDWRWARDNDGGACHTNGTMLFNGDSYTTYSTGYIGDADSKIYNNYLHGSLTDGYAGSSPSGFLSCQDNCGPIKVFNNVVIDTETGVNGGGLIYFNGAGGGGQGVYNNTLVRSTAAGTSECIEATGASRFGDVIAKNNIFVNCVPITVRPNDPNAVTSDYNNGYNTASNVWYVYNYGGSSTMLTLAQYKSGYSQESNDADNEGNPLLDANYRLQVGSASIDTGVDLSSLGISELNYDKDGNTRTGTWDIGAYEYNEGTPANAITGVNIN